MQASEQASDACLLACLLARSLARSLARLLARSLACLLDCLLACALAFWLACLPACLPACLSLSLSLSLSPPLSPSLPLSLSPSRVPPRASPGFQRPRRSQVRSLLLAPGGPQGPLGPVRLRALGCCPGEPRPPRASPGFQRAWEAAAASARDQSQVRSLPLCNGASEAGGPGQAARPAGCPGAPAAARARFGVRRPGRSRSSFVVRGPFFCKRKVAGAIPSARPGKPRRPLGPASRGPPKAGPGFQRSREAAASSC